MGENHHLYTQNSPFHAVYIVTPTPPSATLYIIGIYMLNYLVILSSINGFSGYQTFRCLVCANDVSIAVHVIEDILATDFLFPNRTNLIN